MARGKDTPKRISARPDAFEQGGGNFGFPPGSTVTIVDARADTWANAGENALKGGRQADDPALVLVGAIDGVDEEREVYLGAGKANRLQPSSDGEFFEPADGSSASGLNDGCNTAVFINSVFYTDKKSEAYKKHGKMAVSADLLDDGFSKALVGLKFVAGTKVVERTGLDNEDGRKPRPSLVADEILEQPSGEGKKKSGGGRSSRKRDEEEEEADERPTRRSRGRDKDEEEEEEKDDRGVRRTGARRSTKDEDEAEASDSDVEEACEKAVAEALDLPKFRKGLPIDAAFSAVFPLVRDEKNAQEIAAKAEDEAWLKHKARPWKYDKADDVLLPLD